MITYVRAEIYEALVDVSCSVDTVHLSKKGCFCNRETRTKNKFSIDFGLIVKKLNLSECS